MGRVLPVTYGPTGEIAAAGGGAALPAAQLSAVGRGCGRAVGGLPPYYQHFCGETFFRHRLPLDSSSLTRWRKRIGDEGVEWLLTKTIEAGREAGVISERNAEVVIVDTTVMEKAIAHPTDARLDEKARRRLVARPQDADLSLSQRYARFAPRLAGQVGRYAHACQFKRMRTCCGD